MKNNNFPNLPYRSECKCSCHTDPEMVHAVACCKPDPVMYFDPIDPSAVEMLGQMKDVKLNDTDILNKL